MLEKLFRRTVKEATARFAPPYEVRGDGDELQFVICQSGSLRQIAIIQGYDEGDPRNAALSAIAELFVAAANNAPALITALRDAERMRVYGKNNETLAEEHFKRALTAEAESKRLAALVDEAAKVFAYYAGGHRQKAEALQAALDPSPMLIQCAIIKAEENEKLAARFRSVLAAQHGGGG